VAKPSVETLYDEYRRVLKVFHGNPCKGTAMALEDAYSEWYVLFNGGRSVGLPEAIGSQRKKWAEGGNSRG
jgi:hypothetical protein